MITYVLVRVKGRNIGISSANFFSGYTRISVAQTFATVNHLCEQRMQRFGQKLRALRTQHSMTLQTLARAVGHAAHGYISEIETGKKLPTVEFVLNVANLFNVSTDQLLRDSLDLDTNNMELMPGRRRRMSLVFADRAPTQHEVEKLRLILSTYQDGTGMLAQKNGLTLPGWRDFERSVALAFNGVAQESKAIFDVLLSTYDSLDTKYGLSCKMRSELNRVTRDGRVTIEVSNSAGKFWQSLEKKGLNQSTYRDYPLEVGKALVEQIEEWHDEVSISRGGNVDLGKSSYLVLLWNRSGWYQLYQFRLELPNPKSLHWSFPRRQSKEGDIPARRIIASDGSGTLFEWFGESGGQLKYYPFASTAIWTSERFQLESLGDVKHGILAKAAAYFPQKWAEANQEIERV